MKTTINYLLVILACVCVACEDKVDENTIVVDKTMLVFPSEGGTLSFNITCPTEWDVIKQSEKLNIGISQEHGSGNQTVYVTVDKNTVIVARQKQIAVRAANGVTKNIWIHQTGKGGSDEILQIIPEWINIGGDAGIEKKALVVCQSPRCFWNMYGGADWLEVSKDGQHWEPSTTSIVSTGWEGVDLRFRTVKRNEDTKDRTATFKFYYGGETTSEFTVTQLGSSRASISSSGVLANAIAVDWIYGCDLSYFYTMVTSEDIPLSSITKTQIRKWKRYDPANTSLLWYTNLKENTKYYVYCASFNKYGDCAKSRRGYTTGSSKNQPEVQINNVQYVDGSWKWTTTMNEYADGYYMWVTSDKTYFDYPDAALAWYMKTNLGETELFRGNENHQKQGAGPFMIVTWAHDDQGMASGVIHRQIVGK